MNFLDRSRLAMVCKHLDKAIDYIEQMDTTDLDNVATSIKRIRKKLEQTD